VTFPISPWPIPCGCRSGPACRTFYRIAWGYSVNTFSSGVGGFLKAIGSVAAHAALWASCPPRGRRKPLGPSHRPGRLPQRFRFLRRLARSLAERRLERCFTLNRGVPPIMPICPIC